MRFDLLILTLFNLLQFNTLDPKNVTAPYITSTLEQLDGSRVSIRYRAVHWDPIVTTAVFENDETRDYYNHFVLTTVGMLENNVQIAIGSNRLNPGSYIIGVEALKIANTAQAEKQAVFLVSDENNVLMRIPVVIMQEQGTVPNLSIVFTPGVTDRDFVFNTLYGNLSLTMKMRFSGVPARPSDPINQVNRANNASPMHNEAEMNAAGMMSTVPPAAMAAQRASGRNPMSPQDYMNTISDSKTLGGIMSTQDTSGGVSSGTAAQILNASGMRIPPKPKAGSGTFRIMNIRPSQ